MSSYLLQAPYEKLPLQLLLRLSPQNLSKKRQQLDLEDKDLKLKFSFVFTYMMRDKKGENCGVQLGLSEKVKTTYVG